MSRVLPVCALHFSISGPLGCIRIYGWDAFT